MKTKKFKIFLGIFCSAVIGTILNASAQQTVIKSRHGAWNILCEGPGNKGANAADLIKELEESRKKDDKANNATPVKQCRMIQTVKLKERPNVRLSVMIARIKQKDETDGALLQVIAPPGVFLPNGVAMEIDGKAQGRFVFVQCRPNGCFAQTAVSKKLLKTLKSGKNVNFIAYEGPGRGLPFGVSLKGFTAAYKALKS